MKKINRRTFLQQAGLVTAALATGTYRHAVAAEQHTIDPPGSATTAGTLTVNNGRCRATLTDHGRALVNPGMGWTMHFYSNILNNYGSQLAPSGHTR